MPLQKILFKPGVNRENTRYTTEGGWYECDKIRFRQGNPEVIGGWEQISPYTFNGVCRSLWNWVTLGFLNLVGVGTNTKFYIEKGGEYYDVTPVRLDAILGPNPFLANGTTTVLVTSAAHGATTGSSVIFSGATGTYASIWNNEYQLTVVSLNTYTITVPSAIPAGAYGGTVGATYLVNAGPAYAIPLTGWGAGGWGDGPWGTGGTSTSALQLWNQMNYGEDLIYGPRGGNIYYWDATNGLTSGYSSRGVALNSRGGLVMFTNSSLTGLPTVVSSSNSIAFTEGAALQFSGSPLPTGITANTTYYVFNVEGTSFNLLDTAGNEVSTTSSGANVAISKIVDAPVVQNNLTVSDASRFVMVFGTNDYGSTTIDPMLIRWSGQNDPYNWTPDPTNQAGFTRLSHGSQIITTVQSRQEIVVFTDSSLYSLQYLGPPYVWSSQLLGDNISIISPNAAVIASGIVYWMGVDKFYAYDGRIQTLNCDLRRYIFQDLNQDQALQVFCGTNEGYNEIWWFYCSGSSTTVNRYVIYNYLEKIWYYGTMERTAWLDSGLQAYPIAATYSQNIVNHEKGLNDNTTIVTAPINAYIASSEFDIGDGHNFGFVWRILPDLTFEDSTNSPSGTPATVTMELYGLTNSGSGVTSDASQPVAKSSTYNITEEFTGQIYTRFRGRQMIFKISSNQINTAWQLGAPRIDIRPDGRR